MADKTTYVDDGLQKVWPLVSGVFARVWDTPGPPDAGTIGTATQRNSGQPPKTTGT